MILTMFRTYEVYWKTKIFHNHPLWEVIYRDGTVYLAIRSACSYLRRHLGIVYFTVVFATNIINVIFAVVMTVSAVHSCTSEHC